MSITYQEALETLKSMFGEPWTESTLDAVLRHHEGHMENTVETVLGHGDGDPDELVRRLQDPTAAADAAGDGGGGGGSGTTSGRATPTHSNSSSGGGGGGGSRKRRGIKTQLPPDFLVIPGYDPPSGSSGAGGAGASASGGAAQQDLDADEQLARMLQDELFTQELANNPEFAHLAGAGGRGRAAGSVGGGFPAARRSATSNAQPQGPNVMDKIGEMGENAKKRLTLFARQFNDRMQNPQAHGGGGGLGRLGGGGGGGGAGAGSSTAERRGLLDLQLGDDNDDEEVSFLGNNPVEMGSLSSPGGGGGKKDD